MVGDAVNENPNRRNHTEVPKPETRNPPMITAVFPQLLRDGGIQRLSRHHAVVMATLARENGWPLELLSLSDPAGSRHFTVDGRRVEFTGFGGSRLKLTARVLAAARRTRLLSIHHINLAPTAWAARHLNSKLRYHLHVFGIDVWSPLSPLRQRALAAANLVVSISDDTTARMNAAQTVRPTRVGKLYPTLDPEFMSSLPTSANLVPLPAGVRSPYFLVVGRLSLSDSYKGVDTLISAMTLLDGSHGALRMVVVGDGDDRPRLEALARRHQVADRVVFLGRQPDESLRHLLARCDFFALPSGMEGFGIVFLEAMANRKAVIGGNQGGTIEIIQEGKTGLMVPFNDAAAQARAIERLMESPEERRAMGEAGHQRLVDVFAFEHFERRYREILLDEAKLSGLPVRDRGLSSS